MQGQIFLLISSLLRSNFTGDIKVIHNAASELFFRWSPSLEEIGVDLVSDESPYAAKYQAKHLLDVTGYDWVVFLDADCVVLKPLDHWFETDADVLYVPEPGRRMQMSWYNAYLTDDEMQTLDRTAINSGTFAVRAEHYHELMAAWEEIDARVPMREKCAWDQPAWNRLMLDTPLKTAPLVDQVAFNFFTPDITHILRYTVFHAAGYQPWEKTALMRAVYAARFLDGEAGIATLTGPLRRPGTKIFVLSLSRVRDRRLKVLEQLQSRRLDFELVDALDAQAAKPELLEVSGSVWPLSKGEVACYLSHLGMLQRILDYNLAYAMILEDDMRLTGEGPLTLESIWDHLPPGADHVQLHNMGNTVVDVGHKIYPPGETEHFHQVRPTSAMTVGYLISQRLAAYVLEHHATPMVPIDHLYIQLSKEPGDFGFYETKERLVDVLWEMESSLQR